MSWEQSDDTGRADDDSWIWHVPPGRSAQPRAIDVPGRAPWARGYIVRYAADGTPFVPFGHSAASWRTAMGAARRSARSTGRRMAVRRLAYAPDVNVRPHWGFLPATEVTS